MKTSPPVDIREERPEDTEAIREINRLAFGQNQEGDLVDALRANEAILLSLVAVVGGRAVAHIAYSPIAVGDCQGAALGPMAVLPEFQRSGIGSRLVQAGNRKIAEQGWPFVIVLGHPEFYPRFGFRPACSKGITCEWDVPEDVFMLLVLNESRMNGVTGLAKYRTEFSSVT